MLIERLDAVRERWNLLEHPFYKRWSCGELSRDELRYYAGEYRHAVVALAETATKTGNEEHAREESEHVWLWAPPTSHSTRNATTSTQRSLAAPSKRKPRTPTPTASSRLPNRR